MEDKLKVEAKANSWTLDSLKGKIIFKLTFNRLLISEDKTRLMKECERAIENVIENYELINERPPLP